MNDKALAVIVRYLDTVSEEPVLVWPAHWFEEVSFSRWAAGEILNSIMDHPMVAAEDIIEDFAFRMELYAWASDGRSPSRIFSIAAETAREFLDLI